MQKDRKNKLTYFRWDWHSLSIDDKSIRPPAGHPSTQNPQQSTTIPPLSGFCHAASLRMPAPIRPKIRPLNSFGTKNNS